jgi:hypothetical protein
VRIAVAIALASACGNVRSSESNGDPVRVITIGDNVASNPSYATSYVSLLAENDDALFPEFAGRDLLSHLSAIELVRLDRAGDSYRGLAENLGSLCTCAGDDCASPCIDTTDGSRTLLSIQLGVNDLYHLFLRMVSEPVLRSSPDGALAALRSSIRTVLAFGADPSVFPAPPAIFVVNVFDPTDGRGDLAALAATITPLPPEASEVTPELVERIIAGTNAIIREEAEAIGATVVDVHSAFLGHGIHWNEAELAHHDASDPTYWYQSIVDPNLRGAHELRRELWRAITGEAIDTVPRDLPYPGTLGLPEVAELGWADAVIAARVPESIEIDGLGAVPNSAVDPSIALGPPKDGLDEVVALGALGDYVLLELGEPAIDGEGEDLVVLEFGPLSGGTPEPYRVLVAEAEGAPFIHLGDAAGERAFDLHEVGVARARFVRIESLVHPIDLPALGSPFFPGPEISAVGAVHLE